LDDIKSIIKSVCIISAAICLLEGMASGTRFRSQIKFLLNLIFITVIAVPILKGTFKFEMPDVTQYMDMEYDETENVYQNEIKHQTEENISSVLVQQIEAAGIKCEKIETEVNISETNSISISSVTIRADNFEAAAKVVRNSLGAETEVYNGNT